ncbi:hypothetical protein [Alkalibacterium olivapovliticus]|uniref:Uncharacterized protein n=1 Tax=Alkalibacterium olivapovliticus TaxID=99907 RepID=A0A2T0VVW7_9LACT|nr:hypothetical protein [Alkalibacterium olivapovliticus]PRY75908.1 hypothetical protein CLV38_13313 [Alkalibacterium olivapovliticus]
MNFIIYGMLGMILGTMLILSGSTGDVLGVWLFIGGAILIIQGKNKDRKENNSIK